MTIRAKSRITFAIATGLIAIVGFFIISETQHLKTTTEEYRLAEEMLRGTFELSFLASDYLLYPEERARIQWQSGYNSLGELLESEALAMFEEAEEKVLLEEIHKNYEDMGIIFNKLVREDERQLLNIKENTASVELRRRLMGQLLIDSQIIVSNTGEITDEVHKELLKGQYRMSVVIATCLLTIVLLMILVLLWVARSIIKPIELFQKGADIIGKGNLDYRLDIKTADEIGQVAKSFNEMVTKLRAAYVNLEIKVKERTKELSEAHGKLSSLVESIKLGVIMVDLSLNVVLANPAAKNILGKSPSETLTFKDLDKKMKDTVKISQALSYYVRKGQPLNIQEAMISDRYFRLFMSPVRDVIEKIFIGAVIVIEDITEQKKLDKMRTEIVSITSHQLRTPSSVIKGNLEMVLGGDVGKITKEQKEILNEAYLGNKRMIKLVNDLMDVSKIDKGRFGLKLEPRQLEDLIAEIVKEILPFAKEKHVSLSYIPPSAKLPKIKIDSQRIKQAFQNLIDNAVTYSHIDGKGKVTIKIQKEEKSLKVIVKDNGIGIPKDEQKNIFGRFVRGSNATQLNPGGGTGLGLYIAKAIIEQSEGKIWFVSEEGKGTTFYITFPYEQS